MLQDGRIPLTAEEHAAIERLLAKHGPGSLTREHPGEAGPVLVNIGDQTWRVHESGRTTKVKV